MRCRCRSHCDCHSGPPLRCAVGHAHPPTRLLSDAAIRIRATTSAVQGSSIQRSVHRPPHRHAHSHSSALERRELQPSAPAPSEPRCTELSLLLRWQGRFKLPCSKRRRPYTGEQGDRGRKASSSSVAAPAASVPAVTVPSVIGLSDFASAARSRRTSSIEMIEKSRCRCSSHLWAIAVQSATNVCTAAMSPASQPRRLSWLRLIPAASSSRPSHRHHDRPCASRRRSADEC